MRHRQLLRLRQADADVALSGPPRRAVRRRAARRSRHTRCVQAESHIRTPQAAEEVLAAGHADMVSIVRGQIADPHLVRKAREGRADDVRPCISCNQMCWGRRSRDYWISCLINPSAGREFEWGGDRFSPTDAPRSVVVVGAGPAGLEVARVCGGARPSVTTRRGDGSQSVGSTDWPACNRPDSRSSITSTGTRRQLDQLGVDVRLDTLVDDDVDRRPIGADDRGRGHRCSRRRGPASNERLPMQDRLPGVTDESQRRVDRRTCSTAAVQPSGRVLLIDDLGDWRGIGTAMFVQESRLRRHARDLGADRGERAVPQRRRRADAAALRPRRWRDASLHRRRLVARRHRVLRSTLTGERDDASRSTGCRRRRDGSVRRRARSPSRSRWRDVPSDR